MSSAQAFPKNHKTLQVRFGESIKRSRLQLAISQEELAWRADLHRTYITDIERGARNVTLKSLANLAKALEVSMESLLASANGPEASGGWNVAGLPSANLGEVLMVEDSPTDAELTLRSFRQARFTNPVRVVGDGGAALELLLGPTKRKADAKVIRPHIILLDLNLPTVPGLEVLRQLKADARTKDIPVVVLTVSHRSRDIRECRRLGAEAYIVKPVAFDNFRQVASQLSLEWNLLNPLFAPRLRRKKAA